jgi:hypothetical protein
LPDLRKMRNLINSEINDNELEKHIRTCCNLIRKRWTDSSSSTTKATFSSDLGNFKKTESKIAELERAKFRRWIGFELILTLSSLLSSFVHWFL